MDYKMFYHLEDYLFDEVGPRFRESGKLAPLDLYAILYWKASRAVTTHSVRLKKIGSLEEVAAGIAAAIVKAPTGKEKLEVLVDGQWAFRLPTASAILTVLYPTEFTVYDKRVREQLSIEAFDHLVTRKLWDRYCQYVAAVRESAGQPSLRDADRYLWGRSLYSRLAEEVGLPTPDSLAEEHTARHGRLRKTIKSMRGIGWSDAPRAD